MQLSKETKQLIIDLIDGELKASVYEGLTEEKRKKLGQVYTPGKICIQMIEKFENLMRPLISESVDWQEIADADQDAREWDEARRDAIYGQG